MAYNAPASRTTNDLITAVIWNADIVANEIAINAGAIALASQAVGDIIIATSASQLGRVADVATGQVLVSGGVATAPAYSASPSLTSLTLSTALTVSNGGSGVATHTAYGVIVGGTTATGATQTITPGTSGYLLTSGGASAVPTWAAAATPAAMTLLYANSGTSTAAGATTVDSWTVSGLTAKDSVVIVLSHLSATQTTSNPVIYDVDGSGNLMTLRDTSTMTAGSAESVYVLAKKMQSSTAVSWFCTGKAATPLGTSFAASPTNAWVGGTMVQGLRHNGVTAGGTYSWNIAVYKLAGQ